MDETKEPTCTPASRQDSVEAIERHTKPDPTPKTNVPTRRMNLITHGYRLFRAGDSYVDVPPGARFLHIDEDAQGFPTVFVRLDVNNHTREWRRIVPVKPGSDLNPYAGWSLIQRLKGADLLWFLDPRVYDDRDKPRKS